MRDALLRKVDHNHDGVISFDEFAACLVTFCLFTEADIYQFVFDAFDDDEVSSPARAAAPRAGRGRS